MEGPCRGEERDEPSRLSPFELSDVAPTPLTAEENSNRPKRMQGTRVGLFREAVRRNECITGHNDLHMQFPCGPDNLAVHTEQADSLDCVDTALLGAKLGWDRQYQEIPTSIGQR